MEIRTFEILLFDAHSSKDVYFPVFFFTSAKEMMTGKKFPASSGKQAISFIVAALLTWGPLRATVVNAAGHERKEERDLMQVDDESDQSQASQFICNFISATIQMGSEGTKMIRRESIRA